MTESPRTYFPLPTTVDEAIRLAEFLKDAACIPSPHRGNAATVLLVLDYGHHCGLSPLESLARMLEVIEAAKACRLVRPAFPFSTPRVVPTHH